jgi:hypothetical protein
MNDIQSLKAQYLSEFQKSLPRLKELAAAVREHEVKLTEDAELDEFWRISGDPKTDYELCQLAADLDGFDQFFEDNIAPKLTQQAKASDQPAIDAKTKDALMSSVIELNSLVCVLKIAFEAFPQVGDTIVIEAAECVRFAANKLGEESDRIERLIW